MKENQGVRAGQEASTVRERKRNKEAEAEAIVEAAVRVALAVVAAVAVVVSIAALKDPHKDLITPSKATQAREILSMEEEEEHTMVIALDIKIRRAVRTRRSIIERARRIRDEETEQHSEAGWLAFQ